MQLSENHTHPKHRQFRFEQLEQIELLAAAPYTPPDTISAGVVYHEDYAEGINEKLEDTAGDTFIVAWNGGADGTTLDTIVIDFTQNIADGKYTGPKSYVYFDTNEFTGFPFTYEDLAGNADNGITATYSLSENWQQLTINFIGFTAGKQFYFKIDVDEMNGTSFAPLVEGAEIDGATFTTYFSSANYAAVQSSGIILDVYSRGNLEALLPPNEYYQDGIRSDAANTAGGMIFGIHQTPLAGSISGYVYDDRNNDGIFDDISETGIENVWLELFYKADNGDYVSTNRTTKTDETGYYYFDDIAGGRTYLIRETQPAGYQDGKDTPGTINGISVGRTGHPDDLVDIHIGANEHGIDYNFGEFRFGSISGSVVDDNGAPIPNTVIELYDGDKKVGTTATDKDGNYTFTDLPPGTYTVKEIQPEGYCDGDEYVGSLGGSNTVNDVLDNIPILSGDNGINYNFVENRRSSISGYVYVDANKNGTFDSGETGIANVELTLWVWDAGSQEYKATSKSVTTDVNGYYEFTGLCPYKTYQIRETQPERYNDGEETIGSLGGILDGNDIIGGITPNPAEHGVNYNFGELLKPGSLSGYVYNDKDNSGTFNTGDVGIAGVTLTLQKLVDGSYVFISTTVTNSNGYYVFSNLDALETYRIIETQPEGYDDGAETIGSLGGNNSVNDHIAGIFVGEDQQGVNYNFGEREPVLPPPQKGSLSGYVYVDANNNGIKESGEQGLSGVLITLEKLVDGSYVFVSTTVTNSNGYYVFSNLDALETYRIIEMQPEGYDDGAETIGSLGGDNSVNDHIAGIFVGEDQHGVNYNFGEREPVLPPPQKGSLSGYVYVDANNNGIKESGEQGLSGVLITLEKLVNGEYVYVATTQTAADGLYTFDNLDALETYRIIETQPEGYDDGAETIGSLGGNNSVNDHIAGIFVGEDQHGVNYNFGECEPVLPPPQKGSLSGYVYVDANNNGIKESGEQGLNGVLITLEKLVNGSYVFVSTTVTNSNGYYVFSNLDANTTYRILETQPADYNDGKDTVGSLGGTVTNDTISGILVLAGANGTDYNFGELIKPVDPVEPKIPNTPVPPPSVLLYFRQPSLGGGAMSFGTPYWNAPSVGETLRAGYGGTGMVTPGYAWHLSVINGGYPRENGNADGLLATRYSSSTTQILTDDDGGAGTRYVSVAWTPLPMNQSSWYVRSRDGRVKKMFTFGPDGGIPLVGDFNGDGIDELAVYHNGNWYIDINGNGIWDKEDIWCELGSAGDQPVTGDWDGDGKTDIGIFGRQWSGDEQVISNEPGLPSSLNPTVSTRPKNVPPDVVISRTSDNVRAMKHSAGAKGRSNLRLDAIDHVFQYGNDGDKAVTGDFTGDGITKIGVYREGKWYIDRNGNGQWDKGDVLIDNTDIAGYKDAIPVVGNFNGDGIDKIGLYINGVWYLDTTGDYKFDTKVEFGDKGDYPVVGDFTGEGIAQLAVYRASTNEVLQAMKNMPEAAPAEATGIVAKQFGSDSNHGQGTLPENLQHHGRTHHTPHSNAPLQR